MNLDVTIIRDPVEGRVGDEDEMRSLWDTLHHVDRLDRTIERLKQVREKAMEAAVCAAGRTGMGRDEAVELYEWLHERDLAGRSYIYHAAGWSYQTMFKGGWPRRGRPCVYLLRNGPEVIYVGRSIYPKSRVKHHRRSGKIFDAIDIWICRDEGEMIGLERDLIRQHFDSLENQRHEEVLL